MRLLSGLGSILLLAACGSAPKGEVNDCASNVALPGGVSTDILFVIDNSGSMAQEQARIASELDSFVSVLLDGPVANDFQVGVVTTSVSSNNLACMSGAQPKLTSYDGAGELQQAKDLQGKVLDPGSPRILRHDDPDFLTRFSALVGQGIHGSGQEMPLEAARKALTDKANAGFLRDGSRLLVVIVTDEDDCSDPTGTAIALQSCTGDRCSTDADCRGPGNYCLEMSGGRVCQVSTCDTPEGEAALAPVSDYVHFLQNMDDGTGRKRQVFLAAIGPVSPENLSPQRCTSAMDEANGTGVRLHEAAVAFGADGLLASICSPTYGESLRAAAGLVAAPHVITLENAPADGHLLVVNVKRGSETIECRLGDGFSYAYADHRAEVTLDGRCRLHAGDRIETRIFCAG